jgi:hypothetical protein
MNNILQDDTFGEITFDGIYWIKTKPVSLVIGSNKFDLRVEIQSDRVYDWFRLGKLSKETADVIFNPELAHLRNSLSRLEKMREMFSRAFLQGRDRTQKSIEEAFLRELSEMTENNISPEEKLNSIRLLIAREFDDRIEIKFNCEWYAQGIGYLVMPYNGEISIKPADMHMEELKNGFQALGFEIKECKQIYYYVYSAKIPTKEQVLGLLNLFTGYEEMFFWNYYHKGSVEPGSYINIQFVDGKPYINESTHGCGGNYKNVDMDVLVEFIIRNWDKDSDWGLYDHQVAIQPSDPKYILNDISRRTIETFYPDYSATPE